MEATYNVYMPSFSLPIIHGIENINTKGEDWLKIKQNYISTTVFTQEVC